jgi:tetratricopeptide (TPR) repeat protein
MRAAFDTAVPAIARATAVSLLPSNPGPRTLEGIERAAGDSDELVRRAAAEALQSVDPATRLRIGRPLLDDSIRTVRLPAVSALAAVPAAQWEPRDRARFEAVAEEYRLSQRVNADRPESWLNLGQFEAQLQRPAEAEAAYRGAIRLAPRFAAGYVALAQVYADGGREGDAERVLREGLAAAPEAADLHHALGLSLVRQKRTAEALAPLGAAARLDTASARFGYVYAVALFDQGEARQAIAVLTAAETRHPADRDILQALASFSLQTADLPAARRWAERLVEVAPDDAGARQQLEQISRMRVLQRP